MVVDGADGAQKLAAGVADLQPDQVGVVKLVIGQARQAGAVGVQGGAFQGIGLLFGGDAGDPASQATGDIAGERDGEFAGAILGPERAIGGDVLGRGAEAFQADLAHDTESTCDGADTDPVRRVGHRRVGQDRLWHQRVSRMRWAGASRRTESFRPA